MKLLVLKKMSATPGLLFGLVLGSLFFSNLFALGNDLKDWREKMSPITPRGYLCQFTATPLTIDGALEENAWKQAAWSEDFVDIQGAAQPKPRLRTRMKMLWDDDYLYIAAELEEPHVWATLTKHDSVIFLDPDFEVFIDPDGDTHRYMEFEMNALNTTWDLRLNKPYMDQGQADNSWEIPGAKTAVHVNGTLNNSADVDRSWTVEVAFPWKVLSENARHAGPPTNNEQWRIDFSRVEWQITTNQGAYQKVPKTPEDNWVWSPSGVVDMHRPEMWGRVQFVRAPGAAHSVADFPGDAARKLALELYYAQRDFSKAHNRWATNTTELAAASALTLPDAQSASIELTADGYVAAVNFQTEGQNHTWRIRQDRLLKLDEPMPVESEAFINAAAKKYGDAGRRAAYFLTDNMPARDRAGLSSDFWLENLSLAFAARTNFPWAKTLPERLFFNEVLPYASLDEPRDPWRADFYQLASGIVSNCTTATEAAQALNRALFKKINVHYNTNRRRNNQSPKESIEQGKATCTGLAIILVDACRAVGVPARIAGVPSWAQKEGNHTWVEIWDGDWKFTGADEYDTNGLDRGWFNNDAALTAKNPEPIHQIYASSWRRTGTYFPLSWDAESREIPAVNVSARYAALATDGKPTETIVHVRLREQNNERAVAHVEMRATDGKLLATGETRAGTADLNDMPDFKLPQNVALVNFRFTRDGQTREKPLICAKCATGHTIDFNWNELTPVNPGMQTVEKWLATPAAERGAPPDVTFSQDETARFVAMAWGDLKERRSESAAAELAAKNIVLGEHSLKWMEKDFGDAPDGKRSLWITLHGGGQATSEENDLNWKGYFGRYEFPPGSINVAPRAPANTWDMWHVPWVDDLFDRLIADMALERGVDLDRVYLIGYSAGGDGVYQLAPRMSDRFAAATMCAGHPNQVTPEGLRNLPFFLYMGGDDAAYNRNVVVRDFSAKLDALQKTDPDGYAHRLTVFPGLPHNMQNRESEAIPRMTVLSRIGWPRRVVWKQQTEAIHNRFYWLECTDSEIKSSEIYSAHVEGQTIAVESPEHGSLTLRLSDELLDLDQPVKVTAGGRIVFEGKVTRSFAAIAQSLQQREDLPTVASALLPVTW